jgi:hypothetical protein
VLVGPWDMEPFRHRTVFCQRSGPWDRGTAPVTCLSNLGCQFQHPAPALISPDPACLRTWLCLPHIQVVSALVSPLGPVRVACLESICEM